MRRLLIRDSQSAPLLLRPALSSLLIFGSPSITSDGSIRITIDYDRCIRIMTELRPELDFFLSLFPSVLCASALDQSKRLFLSLSLSLSVSSDFYLRDSASTTSRPFAFLFSAISSLLPMPHRSVD